MQRRYNHTLQFAVEIEGKLFEEHARGNGHLNAFMNA